ncbi:MAG: hypothetical protein E3J64_08650, partial [Anaerolineales bacterium]
MPEAVSEPQAEKVQQPSLSVPITDLGLRARARSVLLGVGMNTVGDVLGALEREDKVLTDPQTFAPELLIDLKRQLRRRGYTVPGEPVATASVAPKTSVGDRLRAALQSVAKRQPRKATPPRAKKPRREEKPPREKRPHREKRRRREKESRREKAMPGTGGAAARLGIAKTRLEAARQRPQIATPLPQEAPPKEAKPRRKKARPRIEADWVKKQFARASKDFKAGGWFYGVCAAFAIIGLFLPPFSLGQALANLGGKALRADRPLVFHPDGITLSVGSEFTGDLRVNLDAVPEDDFNQGEGGELMKEAAAALPDYMSVESPVYLLDVSGESAEPVTIEILMPGGAEPWETLDLYTWTGEAWEFVPSELVGEAEAEVLRTQLIDVPSSLALVQTGPVTPTVSALLGEDDIAAGEAVAALDEINPWALILGTAGTFQGDPADLPLPDLAGDWAVMPSLRNWAPGKSVNAGLVSGLINNALDMESHISSILQMCNDHGFAGVEVDYRGLGADDAAAYGDFIEALAGALKAEGLMLSVVLDPPTQTETGWDAGGYDWATIGAHADSVKVRLPEDPRVYADETAVTELLDWTVDRIHRHKVRIVVSSLSLELSEGSLSSLSLEEALAPFGEVVSLDETNQYEVGAEVHLGLAGTVFSVTPQEAIGTYSIDYEVAEGE